MKAYSAFVFGGSLVFLAVLGIHTSEAGVPVEPAPGVLWFLAGVFLTGSAIGWMKFDD